MNLPGGRPIDPLMVDSLIEVGLLLGAGIAVGAGLLYLLTNWTRGWADARRRRWVGEELQRVRAQAEERRAQIAVPPPTPPGRPPGRMVSGFPRAPAHIARLRERAEAVQAAFQAAEWTDAQARIQCMQDLDNLIRHCRELEEAMRPPKRRPRPPPSLEGL